MNLKLQIITLIFSFLYGIFFCILLNINYKFLYSNKKFFKIISTMLFIIFNVLLYFIILRKINNGIFHPYFVIMLTLGFFTSNIIHSKLAGLKKKWYNAIIGECYNGY